MFEKELTSMKKFRMLIAWALLATTCLYLLSGFGISHFRIVTPLTFGIMDKLRSLKIHDNLIYFFIPLLILHIAMTVLKKIRKN